MLKIATLSVVFLGLAAITPANAGCLKGALLGGIAGKMVGHGYAGAAAGCALGAHKARARNANNFQNGRGMRQDRM